MEAERGLGGLYFGAITDSLVTMIFRRQLRRDLRQLNKCSSGKRPPRRNPAGHLRPPTFGSIFAHLC
jgi:hypothetical protein